MSSPVDWEGANKVLIAIKGTTEEQVSNLPIFTNGSVCVSKWLLSEEAIAEIIKTKCTFISLMSGKTQPPVFIGSEKEVREIVIDYGKVWKI